MPGVNQLITLSLVSHGQGDLVVELVNDLERYCKIENLKLILTLNLSEKLDWLNDDLPFSFEVRKNHRPKGFAGNHNAAFKQCSGEWFCVLNPDIRLRSNPFPVLLEEIQRRQAAVVAPAIVAPSGSLEDGARSFPSLSSLLRKFLGRGDGRYSFALGDPSFDVDWVGGMFMLFRAEDFRAVGGFDEGFFLYYEDVDICARLWKAGRPVLACPKAEVIHDARRSSRKSLRYMRWHAASMLRYFWKHWGRLPKRRAG